MFLRPEFRTATRDILSLSRGMSAPRECLTSYDSTGTLAGTDTPLRRARPDPVTKHTRAGEIGGGLMQGGAPETTGWLEGLSYRKYLCKYRDRLPSRPPTRHPETDEAGHGGGTARGDWQLVTPPSPRPISVKNKRAGASPVLPCPRRWRLTRGCRPPRL